MAVVHRFTGTMDRHDWESVRTIQYPDGAAKSVHGKILIGSDEGAPYFVFRYFCVEPGGHSTLDDYHAHDHGVLILHGRARVSIGTMIYELGPRDIIYIPPWEIHSFSPVGDQPLGFLCVIPNKELMGKLQNLEAQG